MRYVSVSVNPDRVKRQRRIWPDLEVFEGTSGCRLDEIRTVCIPDTYKRLAEWAVGEGLGRETIVMMDDVWLPQGPGFPKWVAQWEDSPLLIFGSTMKDYVDPRAFSAIPDVWVELSKVWRGEGRIWRDWDPVVERYGTVLDVTAQMG